MTIDVTATPEGDVMGEKSVDEQITDLLTGAGETGDLEELEQEAQAPAPDEEATQEDDSEEADKPDAEEAKQEAAEEEAATWGQALGLDDSQIVLDDDGNFSGVITKVEGETQQVDLKELVKGYQIDKYNNRRSEAMANERKQFEEYANKQAQELKQRVDQAQGLVNTLEKQLVGEFDSINWEQLRVADPAEYAARRQDFAVRYNQVQQMAHGITQEQAQEQQKQQVQAQQASMQHLQKEAQRALEIKPEWSDPEVRTKAMTEMGTFIQNNYGYGPEEVAGITDHRVIGLIEDAMAYQAIKSKSVPKIKKSVPKFQKPGGHAPAGGKKAQLNKLYKKAAASSNRDLKDDAITQLLLNS